MIGFAIRAKANRGGSSVWRRNAVRSDPLMEAAGVINIAPDRFVEDSIVQHAFLFLIAEISCFHSGGDGDDSVVGL